MSRRIWCIAILATLALGARFCAVGEGGEPAAWTSETHYEYYYHATGRCRFAANAERQTQSSAEAQGKTPCPVCWPDEAAYADVETYERGGTLVIRIPDSTIAERMFGMDVPAAVPEELLCSEANRLDDVARLVHGEDYCRWAESAVPGTEQKLEATIPDLDAERTDALLMSRRHIGAAWVLIVRPNENERKALNRKKQYELPVVFYRADLRIASYDAGATLAQGDGSTRWAGTLTLTPKKSGGEVAYRNDDDIGDWPIYVVRDGGINAAVIRAPKADRSNATGTFKYCGQSTRLEGYVDGKDIVYICALTDGELAALKEKLGYNLYNVAEDGENGEPADATALAPDYRPATCTALACGTEAAMDQAEYPVGTGFVGYTLTRPEGGIQFYGCNIALERFSDGQWRDIGSVKAYADGDPERAHAGYFCDHVRLTVPLEGVGALEEGLYRLHSTEDDSWIADSNYRYLEFRVTAGAPKPIAPERRTFGGEGIIVFPHEPRSADAAGYNSCADTSRVYEGGSRTRVLAGDMVFELRGVDESWGWGICSNYSLFAYPEGHPGQARQLLANFDQNEVTMFDLGDGLLLCADRGAVFRCDYDGGNLAALGTFGNGGYVNDYLPVGGGLYAVAGGDIWVTPLAEFSPRAVYTSPGGVDNYMHGGGFMVYADGKLLVADGGILALDALHANDDGTLPATRLTDAYDAESGANGYGYIVLNGRLYCWSEEREAMVSMDLDGGDVREVSKERYWFNAVSPSGVVLALYGTQQGFWGDERAAAALFFPPDPQNPTFDPDHSEKLDLEPDCFDCMLGAYLYHRDGAGNETMRPLAEVSTCS